ncbi:multicopper oxidase family protein [Amycolatopsis saalfeldensis]|uniref:Multicopper oxidase with three cupredoxin domains (Includes cell division protein FtsP and spore coat protein CotA) n=1 Tax=Amycolatopsis saalfeldensis TaxID=394193 RepID=A0A1H8YMZ0_9PSEU|nr:multicopper oxidase family protein [Amycolatopsis saalfeldensis]SEP53529.1 Multicopper oxidase with three cupredoxin domains (includes cell division protein FtsP and spore coat protein CotA) [Amycolatopsis saalfeldensis]
MTPAERSPMIPNRLLNRRGFLALGAGATAAFGLAACSSGGSSASQQKKIGPTSPLVNRAEAARRPANASVHAIGLTAQPGEIDLGGVTVKTWSYGQLPGPEIRLKRGQVLRAKISNRLPQPTTIHWHGLALRNDMDGVPDLTQPAVAAGRDFTYEFTAPEAGTFWFHPHVGVQLDRGLYGPLIVEDPADGKDYDAELVIVLDDWIDGAGTDPDAVLAGLKKNGMSMGGTPTSSMPDMPGMGSSPSTSMPGMGEMPKSALLGGDAGDVTYPYFLANGRRSMDPASFAAKPGQRIRLRLINAGGDTAFRVGVPGAGLRITHTDGFPAAAASEAAAVLLGMGERVDAVFTVPTSGVPVLAVAEGKGGYAQVLVHAGGSRASAANDGAVEQLKAAKTLTVADFTAAPQVSLAEKTPDVTHDLKLSGPGAKYDWTVNGKAYNPNEDGLPVRQGQRVRLRFVNDTDMYHPMHLHGHTFQVRGQRSPGPRKDTVLILPRRTVEVDFDADNPGQWLSHCHNVYHGEAGMMTVVSYVE